MLLCLRSKFGDKEAGWRGRCVVGAGLDGCGRRVRCRKRVVKVTWEEGKRPGRRSMEIVRRATRMRRRQVRGIFVCGERQNNGATPHSSITVMKDSLVLAPF